MTSIFTNRTIQIKLKIQFFFASLTFQVFSNRLQLVATVLDYVDINHFHHSTELVLLKVIIRNKKNNRKTSSGVPKRLSIFRQKPSNLTDLFA